MKKLKIKYLLFLIVFSIFPEIAKAETLIKDNNSSKIVPPLNSYQIYDPYLSMNSAVVRGVTGDTDSAKVSGVVIGPNKILTAAHAVANLNMYSFDYERKEYQRNKVYVLTNLSSSNNFSHKFYIKSAKINSKFYTSKSVVDDLAVLTVEPLDDGTNIGEITDVANIVQHLLGWHVRVM